MIDPIVLAKLLRGALRELIRAGLPPVGGKELVLSSAYERRGKLWVAFAASPEGHEKVSFEIISTETAFTDAQTVLQRLADEAKASTAEALYAEADRIAAAPTLDWREIEFAEALWEFGQDIRFSQRGPRKEQSPAEQRRATARQQRACLRAETHADRIMRRNPDMVEWAIRFGKLGDEVLATEVAKVLLGATFPATMMQLLGHEPTQKAVQAELQRQEQLRAFTGLHELADSMCCLARTIEAGR